MMGDALPPWGESAPEPGAEDMEPEAPREDGDVWGPADIAQDQ